jgi:hypothetical protein
MLKTRPTKQAKQAKPVTRKKQQRTVEIPITLLRDGGIRCRLKGFLVLLATHQGDDDEIVVGWGQLASETGVTEETVRIWLSELKGHGLVTWRKPVANQVNHYRLTVDGRS